MIMKLNIVVLNVVKNLIQCGVNFGYIIFIYRLYGYCDVSISFCFGDVFYNEIKIWLDYSIVVL